MGVVEPCSYGRADSRVLEGFDQQPQPIFPDGHVCINKSDNLNIIGQFRYCGYEVLHLLGAGKSIVDNIRRQECAYMEVFFSESAEMRILRVAVRLANGVSHKEHLIFARIILS